MVDSEIKFSSVLICLSKRYAPLITATVSTAASAIMSTLSTEHFCRVFKRSFAAVRIA